MAISQQQKRDALEKLQDEYGRITASIVVKAARNPKHVLHSVDEFHWDDESAAAHLWRLEVARGLIRTTLTVPVADGPPIRVGPAYVRNPDCGPGEQGYMNVAHVKTDADRTRQVLLSEFDRARAALQRAYDIAAVLEARDQIPPIIEKINGLREQMSNARL